jgi:hypothetical protein
MPNLASEPPKLAGRFHACHTLLLVVIFATVTFPSAPDGQPNRKYRHKNPAPFPYTKSTKTNRFVR